MELQLQLIQKHLGVDFRLPPASTATDVKQPAATPTHGRLVVRNFTEASHYLSVNNVQYVVSPGRTDIWVPFQVVEAYLPVYEPRKVLGTALWRWTGRDYEMPLEIKY